VFDDRLETFFLGLSDEVEDRTISSHQFPDGVARTEEAVHRRAPDGADSIASCATALVINDVAGRTGNVKLGASR
jgi:hypothetical protein